MVQAFNLKKMSRDFSLLLRVAYESTREMFTSCGDGCGIDSVEAMTETHLAL